MRVFKFNYPSGRIVGNDGSEIIIRGGRAVVKPDSEELVYLLKLESAGQCVELKEGEQQTPTQVKASEPAVTVGMATSVSQASTAGSSLSQASIVPQSPDQATKISLANIKIGK